jgi:hypothetical protein
MIQNSDAKWTYQITMRFTLGITTKYIDRNPTASMTNNPPSGCRLSNHQILSCEQRITALSKVRKVNKANLLGHKKCCFLPSGNSTSTTLEVSVTPPDY